MANSMGKRKLENFEELERNVRPKFSDIPDGDKIKAHDSKGDNYNHVDEERSESPESAVVIDGVNYRIDQIPSPDSPIVQAMKKEFNTDVCNIDAVSLDTRLGKLCEVADVFQVAVTAGIIRGANLHDLVEASDNIIRFLLDLSKDVAAYYASCTSTCKSVVEVVMVAAGFHLDGFDDMTIKELSKDKLAKASSRMASDCQKLAEEVNAHGLAKVEEVQKHVSGGIKLQESNEELVDQLSNEIKKKNLEINEKRANLEELKFGAEQRQNRAAQSRDYSAKAATGAGSLATVLSNAVGLGAGIEAGVSTMTLPVVGVRLALLALTATFLNFYNKQTSNMDAQQVADEAELARRRQEETKALKELGDLVHKLGQTKAVDSGHVLTCLHLVSGQLKMLRQTLSDWKKFWKKLATIFLPRQQETEERFVDYAKETDERLLHAMISGAGFREMLIKYLARWVAFQEHCEKSHASIQANLGPLQQLTERNLTPAEARAKLPNTAHAIDERLAADGQTDAAI